MAQVLAAAPVVVEVEGDDGWAAACLAVSGRLPVAGAGCDVQRMERTLRRLGLPRLGTALAAAVLTADLRLSGHAEPGHEPLPWHDGMCVSILICTRDRAGVVGEAIASARAQSWPCEIVVVDDGSTDSTPAVLAAIDGIRVFRQAHAGKAAALNRALAVATGDAFLVLDEDDTLMPGTIRILGHALETHPELVAVWGDSLLGDPAAAGAHRWLPATSVPAARALQQALIGVPALLGATLVRRHAQERAGAYDTDLVVGQHADMLQRLARTGPIEGVPVPVHVSRRHAGPRSDLPAPLPTSDPRTGHQQVLASLGLLAPPATPTDAVVIVDDGDVGALEECLQRHADGRAIWVDLEVPRDPLENIRVLWRGDYAARERIHRWVTHVGPVHLRLSSAPDWAPPPLRGVADLPDLPAVDALLAIAAALDWPFPQRTRGVSLKVAHPIARLMIHARLGLRKDQPRYALNRLTQIVKLAPEWRLGWQVTAEVFDTMGYANEAASCRNQAMNCRVAAA